MTPKHISHSVHKLKEMTPKKKGEKKPNVHIDLCLFYVNADYYKALHRVKQQSQFNWSRVGISTKMAAKLWHSI